MPGLWCHQAPCRLSAERLRPWRLRPILQALPQRNGQGEHAPSAWRVPRAPPAAAGEKEFPELLAEQGGVCVICGGADPQYLDHDHRTGWARGILCFNCNGGLGQFRDSPMRLARAITYLRGTTWQRALIHPGVYQMCSPTRGRPPSPRF
ncbi:endonuclease VII domain-containing protein [Micromonospora sp. NPDC005413]|uniref:endonuclease VII domain-containing protein n=1 Tax=Micromonospora sp. NPDC005413 TaxID=3154563 RepID=UPI0033A33712